MRMENQESYNLIPIFSLTLEAFFCTNILDRQPGISLPSILTRLFASISRKASGCMCLVHNLVPQTARARPYSANQRPVYSSPHWCQYTLPHRCSDTTSKIQQPVVNRRQKTMQQHQNHPARPSLKYHVIEPPDPASATRPLNSDPIPLQTLSRARNPYHTIQAV